MTDAPGNPLNFRAARFLTSAPGLAQCPADSGAEVAFAGRSNAGKSSAINALTGQSRLARTSKTPGRTQLLNFFVLDEERRLVDLPDYGFAKVPIAVKEAWQRNMEQYLSGRLSLKGLILLMDIRHPLQPFDELMLTWARRSGMPVHLLLTKADKLKYGAARTALLDVQRRTGGQVSVQLFSSVTGTGLPELQQRLNEWLAPAEEGGEA